MLVFHKIARGTRVTWAFGVSLTELLLRRPKARRARAEWLTRFCRRVLAAAGVTWEVAGPVPLGGAVISNHLTYLDILVHSAVRPCVFVSAIEIRRMPLIGWISMMAGTVYVTRGAGGSAAKAAGGMAEGFRDGLPVVFFPEGGTGEGEVPLLPLHTGLLANALEDGADVTASFLRYQLSPVDASAGRTAGEDIYWGKQTLPAHIWNFMALHGVQAQLSFAPGSVPFSPAALSDRRIAAEEARTSLMNVYEANSEKKIVYNQSNV